MFNRPILKNYAKTGRGQQVATFPWLSVDFETLGTSAVGFALGSTWYDEFGNEFKVYQNSAAGALAFGNLVTWESIAADTDAVAAAPAPTIRAFGLVAGAEGAAGALVGSYIYNATKGAAGGATGADSLKYVKANAGTGAGQLITVSLLDTKRSNLQADADAYLAVPVAGQVTEMIVPYKTCIMPTALAAVGRANGVAQGAVVASAFYMAQVGGLALVTATGGVTPLVRNQHTQNSGVTAGNVIGPAAAVTANSPGISCAAYAAAVGGVAPLWLTLKGQI